MVERPTWPGNLVKLEAKLGPKLALVNQPNIGHWQSLVWSSYLMLMGANRDRDCYNFEDIVLRSDNI